MRLRYFSIFLPLALTMPAAANGVYAPVQQEGAPPPPMAEPSPASQPLSQTARSATGRAGERQTRDNAAQQAGIKPMARLAGRIQNRVQNRIRNRIDRSYDPQANATDPFVVAGEQARKSGRPR